MPTDEEIDRFLSRLGEEWKKIPDATFGELIWGLMLTNGKSFPAKSCNNGEVTYRRVDQIPLDAWWEALDGRV